ncbi:MAG: glycosyltransferase [Planctomycetes bacterium]|nr:glycosyltransferase [Planctomycetota bacterium]
MSRATASESVRAIEPEPAPGVSACLIVRDEEERLQACLASLREWVEEICVLDTGSSDRTVDVARRAGAIVGHAVWQDDFSAARNVALRMATQPWVLVIDADEELAPGSGAALRSAIAARGRQVWLVDQDNLVGPDRIEPLAVPRLFRNRPEIRFRRRVHESVMDSLIALGETDLRHSGVHLLHHGYLPAAVGARDKRRRNLELLQRCCREDPRDVFALHKLGSALSAPEQRAERVRVLERARALARAMSRAERASHPCLPLVYGGLADALCGEGRLARAVQVCEEGLALFPRAPELRYRRGDLARRAGQDNAARKWLGSCLGAGGRSLLDAGAAAARGVKPLLGLVRPAFEAERLDEARLLLSHALALDPRDTSARLLDVEVKLARAETLAEGIAALERLIAERPAEPEVLVIAARLAWSENERATAMSLWRRAARGDSDAGLEARCLLAIGLLGQGDIEGAAVLHPRLVARDLFSAACRLVVAVVAGRDASLDPALEREGVTAQLVGVLGELLRSPSGEAAALFAARAPRYARVLPGIQNLLVDA